MANITVTLYWDLDLRIWTTTLGGTTEQGPIQGLVQGDTVLFNVRFVQGGSAVTLTAPVFTASGIKAQNDFTGSYLIQLSAPTGSPPLYTFTVSPLNSANLNTFLQTYRNTWCALEIYDSANGILTTPLELQITPGYSLSGTPTDNAPGVVSVAAGKTVTFPLSLTFPSAAGTNGYKLTTNGGSPETLTWTADATGSGTVTTTGTMTADTIVLSNGTTVIKSTTTGAGVVTALGNTPNATGGIVTFSGNVGAATATSINGNTITAGAGTLTLGVNTINLAAGAGISATGGSINLSGGSASSAAGGSIETNGGTFSLARGGSIATYGGTALTTPGGSLYTFGGTSAAASGGNIYTYGSTLPGGDINTSNGGGSINTTGSGSIGFGVEANRITLVGTAGSNGKTITLPNATGTVALTSDITGGTLEGSFATLAASGVTSITNTTDASNTTTASLKTAGGLGVVKTAWLGADIRFATNGAGGAGNIFLGTTTSRAGNGATTTGSQNVCIGSYAGQNLTTGQSNVILGDQAGSALTTGSYNMCIGYTALGSAGIGADYNIAIGAASLLNVTSGDNNVGIGRNAGNTITTGGNNTFIGYDSDGVAGLSNQSAIGTGAICTAANQVMLGTSSDIVTLPGGMVTVPIAQTATTAAVSVAVTTTALTTTAPAQAITLADGTNGQIKIITHVSSSGGGTAVLTPSTSAADYNTITFSAVGDTAILQYHTTGGWYILALRGAVAA